MRRIQPDPDQMPEQFREPLAVSRGQRILPKGSAIVSEALSVKARGHELLFELMRTHDLEGIIAKRLEDPYDPRVRWLKIKNDDYSQKEGREDLFNGPRNRPAHSVG